ncbi:MAG: S16 family serine protease, partial [Nanoarchaeota archaeon]
MGEIKHYRVFFGALLLLLFVAIFSANALPDKVYHLKLLAVQETENGYNGSDADVYLELREGTGRVFLDTYPLTKMDTQISTRFAKEISCKHYDLECEKYDFIYTIKAKSNIVGGPSAGAAMAALTTIALMDLPYDESITVTGTINSGATIGPVGGVKEKLEAAKNAGLKKVLIAKGTAQQLALSLDSSTSEATSNITINNTAVNSSILNSSTTFNLVQYGKNNLGLEVAEVGDLDEVIFQLTGKRFNQHKVNLSVNPEYQKIMKGLQQLLCARSVQLERELLQSGISINQNLSEELTIKRQSAQQAAIKSDYYSSASFCFGTNIILKEQYYRQTQARISVLNTVFSNLERKTAELKQKLAAEPVDSISKLQALMIVEERLHDVEKQINLYQNEKNTVPLEKLYPLLAYAEERYFSALSWMQFLSMEGKKFKINEEQLQNSCLAKISEAEERYQYASLYLGELVVQDILEKISGAQESSQKKEYGLCLMEASQAKAEASAILSSLGATEANFKDLSEAKIKAVERVISENTAEGVFPILGYSYYQYALSLREKDRYTALVYLEYALEMGDLGIYFPEENEPSKESSAFFSSLWKKEYEYLLVGMIVGGMLLMYIVIQS